MTGADALLRAAVIGLGVGERHIAGYETDPRCRVVALCDKDADRLAEVGRRYPGRRLTTAPEAILDDPDIDVVSIATYDDAHHAQVVRALVSGKHVFVEKPLCLHDRELADIRREAALRPHLKLSSNLILRKSPRFSALRRRVRSGELGDVYYAEGDYNYGRLAKLTEGWRGAIPYYSVVHGGAVHMVDLLLWVTGKRVAEVSAMGTAMATRGTAFRYNDTVAALLRFSDGSIGKVTANFPCVCPHHHAVSLYGTAATFVHRHDGAHLVRSRDPDQLPDPVLEPFMGASKGDMLPGFIQAILGDGEPEVSAAEVFEAMAVCMAIEQSATTGRAVMVDDGKA